jgi:hypothetical protein
MRAVLDQRHEPHLREGALPPTGPGQAELRPVLLRVRHVQAGAVEAGQPPATVPRPLGGGGGDRLHQLLVEPLQRRFSEPAAGLRDAALASNPDRLRTPEPA